MRTEIQLVKAPATVLSELLSDPGRASSVPAEAIPSLRGLLAQLDTVLLGRLLSGSANGANSQHDRLLDAEEAAAKLACTKDWLYRHADSLPFTVRNGKKHVRFSESGIDDWIRLKSAK